jgi:hypothetical protein
MIHLMIDIEALGLLPGAALIEIGAVAFDPATFEPVGEVFHRQVVPHRSLMHDPGTIAWHLEKGTWPRPDVVPRERVSTAQAELDLAAWVAGLGEVQTVWAWGAGYDFPVLEAAFKAVGELGELPWKYWQAGCARTLWRLAFPDQRAAPRPHHAVEDCKAAIRDLQAAIAALRGPAAPAAMAAEGSARPAPSVLLREGLREIGDAALLTLLAGQGHAGANTLEAAAALRIAPGTIGGMARRLVAAGLASPPVRDPRRGRPCRYFITDYGRKILAEAAAEAPPATWQPPLAIL